MEVLPTASAGHSQTELPWNEAISPVSVFKPTYQRHLHSMSRGADVTTAKIRSQLLPVCRDVWVKKVCYLCGMIPSEVTNLSSKGLVRNSLTLDVWSGSKEETTQILCWEEVWETAGPPLTAMRYSKKI